MKRWLKKYFIPHQENEHKPHFLRWETTLIILSVVLFIEILFLVQIFVLFPNVKFFASIMPSVLVDLTNENRQNKNCPSLAVNSILEKAAALKAQDMATKGYFAHISPEGRTPWYWLEQVGYTYVFAGENLAVNFFDSEDVAAAWMNSATHRQNIENPYFTEIGIASARGIYQGRETIFVVQFFGMPLLTEMPTIVSAPVQTMEKPTVALNQPKNQATSSEAKVEGGSKTAEQSESENATCEVYGVSSQETIPPKYSSVFARVISTPHAVTNYIYLVLATIITLALALTIFVKINVQHPRLIINGVIILLIIGTALSINQCIILFLGRIS
jgi:hypothetical protein